MSETGPLQGRLSGFIDHLRHERRLSPATVESYQRDLEQFLSWLADNETGSPDKINQHLVRAWVASRHRQNISGKSLQRQLSSLRTFFRYLLREGVITRPIANYGLPNHLRVTVGLPEENARFLAALKKVLGR